MRPGLILRAECAWSYQDGITLVSNAQMAEMEESDSEL